MCYVSFSIILGKNNYPKCKWKLSRWVIKEPNYISNSHKHEVWSYYLFFLFYFYPGSSSSIFISYFFFSFWEFAYIFRVFVLSRSQNLCSFIRFQGVRLLLVSGSAGLTVKHSLTSPGHHTLLFSNMVETQVRWWLFSSVWQTRSRVVLEMLWMYVFSPGSTFPTVLWWVSPGSQTHQLSQFDLVFLDKGHWLGTKGCMLPESCSGMCLLFTFLLDQV